MRRITVRGIAVDVVRKPIRNLHLGVYPPHGRVRVAAPLLVSDDAVRLAVVGRLGWIRRQRTKFRDQPRQSEREMVSGESQYFLGRRYRLRVAERPGRAEVTLKGRTLRLGVPPGADQRRRSESLLTWYRLQLKALIPEMLDHHEKSIGVRAREWRIRKMKTKWGACNVDARRIWLNVDLAKTPVQCIEYIIVHELVHLKVRHHDERFAALMDRHLPDWRARKALLAQTALGHNEWSTG